MIALTALSETLFDVNSVSTTTDSTPSTVTTEAAHSGIDAASGVRIPRSTSRRATSYQSAQPLNWLAKRSTTSFSCSSYKARARSPGSRPPVSANTSERSSAGLIVGERIRKRHRDHGQCLRQMDYGAKTVNEPRRFQRIRLSTRFPPFFLEFFQRVDRVGRGARHYRTVAVGREHEGFDFGIPLLVGRSAGQECIGNFDDAWVLSHDDRGVQATLNFQYCPERRHCASSCLLRSYYTVVRQQSRVELSGGSIRA